MSGRIRSHRRDANLTLDEQAERRARKQKRRMSRKNGPVRKRPPAQMDHASGKRKEFREGERIMKRERDE